MIGYPVYKEIASGDYVRVLYEDRAKLQCYAISFSPLTNGRVNPLAFAMRHFENKNLYVNCSDPFAKTATDADLSARERQFVDKHYKAIKPLIKKIPTVFDPNERANIINDCLKTSTLKKTQLLDSFSKYLKAGLRKNALVSKHSNCGKKGIRPQSEKQWGRPPHERETPLSFKGNATKKDRELIIRGYKYFSKKGVKKQRQKWNLTIAKYYEGESHFPTLSQFDYWVKRLTTKETQVRNDVGDIAFEKDKRMLNGSPRDEAFGIGYEAMMDSTKDDTHSVSIVFGDQYIGRFTLYLIVDVFSAMPMGIYLGPLNPSYSALSLAMLNCVTPKKEYMESVGVFGYNNDDWPCHHLPGKFTGDRAPEFVTDKLNSFLENYTIELGSVGSKRPELKAVVERAIGKLLDGICGVLAGYGLVNKKGSPRVNRDTRKDACLNLNDVLKVIVLEIIKYNRKPISRYPLFPEMFIDKVSPTPLNLWNWAMGKDLTDLREANLEDAKKFLLPTLSVTIHRGGITYKNCVDLVMTTQSGEALRSRLVHSEVKTGTIAYNPDRFDQIYFVHDKKFWPLRPRHEVTSNFNNFYELDETSFFVKQSKKENEDSETKFNKTTTKKQLDIVSLAQRRKRQHVTIKNVKEAKARETKFVQSVRVTRNKKKDNGGNKKVLNKPTKSVHENGLPLLR